MSALQTPPVAAKAVTIRAFEPGDALRISALLTRHSPYRRDAAFWFWLNRTLPLRPSIVAVAEVEGQVVGHYAILPLELRLPTGEGVLAGHGVHALVSPDHRRDVSIFQISAHAYRLAREAGLRFVFGFPNPNYRLVQEKIERWRGVALFKAWTKPAAQVSVGGAGEVLLPADLGNDEQLHAAVELWEQADRRAGFVQVMGQARWWGVRYLQHPQCPYQFHWLVAGGERRGLVATKLFRGEAETRAHLVDYVLAEGQSPAALLRAFEEVFRAQAERLVHWAIDPAFGAALAELGYRPEGFETYFGLRSLDGLAVDPALLNPAAWRLPMGLSDAF